MIESNLVILQREFPEFEIEQDEEEKRLFIIRMKDKNVGCKVLISGDILSREGSIQAIKDKIKAEANKDG